MPHLLDDTRIQQIELRYAPIANLITDTDVFVNDPFVGYHLSRAYDSFMLKFYESTIVYSGLSIEEALTKTYSTITSADPSKKYTSRRTGLLVDVEDTNFSGLVNWGKQTDIGLITTSLAVDQSAIDAIREARNFFAHGHRGISNRIRALLASGVFATIFPTVSTLTGGSVPVLGQLFTETTAKTVVVRTVSILHRIDSFLRLNGSSL